ncbi:hypothetical protein [Lactococcus cremoris]|uniref:hypothetical protein n=1 Tax=Lactococcus lactis subsp. cremoris TaxID=1359 RepID=UPI0024A6BB6D|nr:hypothetical protein [Lactococcus cremoris]
MFLINKKRKKRNRKEWIKTEECQYKSFFNNLGNYSVCNNVKSKSGKFSKLPDPMGFPEINPKLKINGKIFYLWDRGHLKSKEYMKSRKIDGVNSKDNLTTQTTWVNKLAYQKNGDNKLNKESMRYYEELSKTARCYDVEPQFCLNEKIPRQFKITIDDDTYFVDNQFPGLDINYNNGSVKLLNSFGGTLSIQTSKHSSNKTVYYSSRNNTNIYWYDKNKLLHQMRGAKSKYTIKSCLKTEAIKKRMHHSKIEK